MFLRSEKKRGKEIYINESIGTDKEGNEICLIDVICDENEDMADKLILNEDLNKLAGIIDKVLSPRERQIIELRYGIPDGETSYTQREIAKNLNISRSYVSRIEKKALERLKKAFNK